MDFEELMAQIAAAKTEGDGSARVQNDSLATLVDDRGDDIARFGASVLANPTPDAVGQWLQLQGEVADLASDTIGDVTDALLADHLDVVNAVMPQLSAEQQATVGSLFAETVPEEADPAETADNDERMSNILRNVPVTDEALVNASFVTSADPSKRQVCSGTLTIMAADGSSHEYAATTGGFVAGYNHKNGPIPPGVYMMSYFRKSRTETAMTVGGVSFSVNLDPVDGTVVKFKTVSRSALRIHPDGDPRGTHGCVGVSAPADQVQGCKDDLAAMLGNNGRARLTVTYRK